MTGGEMSYHYSLLSQDKHCGAHFCLSMELLEVGLLMVVDGWWLVVVPGSHIISRGDGRGSSLLLVLFLLHIQPQN
jgi:hypothetical protein